MRGRVLTICIVTEVRKRARIAHDEGMELRVKLDAAALLEGLDDLQKKQIPYALAKTLTDCVKDGQSAVQESLGSKFELRNNFTRQGIRIKPADKRGDRIEADVHTDTANRSSGAPDYLGQQEVGGEKVPHGGHQYIAVPTVYLRILAPGVIPAELRPKNLLRAVGGRYDTTRRTKGGERQIALRNQKLVRGMVFFLQRLEDGHMAILGRYANAHDAYPFYLLISETDVKPRLEMEKTVRDAVEKSFPVNWQENFRRIMAKGLKIKV